MIFYSNIINMENIKIISNKESTTSNSNSKSFSWKNFDLDKFFKETNEISEIIERKERENKDKNG